MLKKFTVTLSFLLFSSLSIGDQNLTFSQVAGVPSQKIAAEILWKVYSKLVISINTVEYPGRRSLLESSQGRMDGEVSRIYSIGELYPSLIRVPTPIYLEEAIAFSGGKNFDIQSCIDLKNYSVSIVRGAQYAEECTKEVIKLTVTNDSKTTLKLLNAGKVDIAILSKTNATLLAKEINFSSMRPVSPTLKQLVLYHYLHKKNKHLVPKIDAVINQMRNNGELDRAKKRGLEALLKLD